MALFDIEIFAITFINDVSYHWSLKEYCICISEIVICVVLCMVTSISEKDSCLLGCGALSLGEWFLALQMIVVPLVSVAKLFTRYWTEGSMIIQGVWCHSSLTQRYVPDDLDPQVYLCVNTNSAGETAGMEGVDPFKSGQQL